MQILSQYEMGKGRAFYFDRGELLLNEKYACRLPQPIPEVALNEYDPNAITRHAVLVTPDFDTTPVEWPEDLSRETLDKDVIAVVTVNGGLTVKGAEERQRASDLAELVVAHKVMIRLTPYIRHRHAEILRRKVGFGHSLGNLLRGNELIGLYLAELESQHGVNYYPRREPSSYRMVTAA